ncbi:MAG TPA: serine hydrolase domain-containing protein [Candidatus Tumulicola sp.]|jgi:D-alanyl-D-alanine carboxypeptidase
MKRRVKGSIIGVCALVVAALWLSGSAGAAAPDASLRGALQRDLNQYLNARGTIEHLSAISLSVSLHATSSPIALTAGRSRYGGAGTAATPDDLWQIGSNTKAFTATTLLQLEAEGSLNLDQTVGHWLPRYPAWKSVTIRRLLNMTSGIPTYDSVPAMLAAYAKNPKRNFTISELIAYVYPENNPHAPPPTNGYSYSNTNYLLAELIVERATRKSYASELTRRLFKPLGLSRTFYAETQYPRDILDRMVAGYFFSKDDAPLAPLMRADVHADSVSWLRAAGAIVSTPDDLTRWVRALYAGRLLAPRQRSELLSVVSVKSGKPIAKTSLADPRGFGLGVVQLTDPQMQTVWYYEGDTMGYRMVYVYFPRRDAVIAFGLNSAPDAKQNQSKVLVASIYKTLHAAGRL